MKKLSVAFMTFVFAMTCAVLVAQQQPAGGASGSHMRHPMTPPATGPMLDLANELVDAINKQDTATLEKLLGPDAVYLDEDGHAPPARAWIHKIATGTPAKHIEISATHGKMWDDAGWVSFNYTLTEDYKGQPKTLKGTASIVAKKVAGGDWQIQMVHGALEQKVAGITQ
jgi:ketosteroid isomerase-like protein